MDRAEEFGQLCASIGWSMAAVAGKLALQMQVCAAMRKGDKPVTDDVLSYLRAVNDAVAAIALPVGVEGAVPAAPAPSEHREAPLTRASVLAALEQTYRDVAGDGGRTPERTGGCTALMQVAMALGMDDDLVRALTEQEAEPEPVSVQPTPSLAQLEASLADGAMVMVDRPINQASM